MDLPFTGRASGTRGQSQARVPRQASTESRTAIGSDDRVVVGKGVEGLHQQAAVAAFEVDVAQGSQAMRPLESKR